MNDDDEQELPNDSLDHDVDGQDLVDQFDALTAIQATATVPTAFPLDPREYDYS